MSFRLQFESVRISGHQETKGILNELCTKRHLWHVTQGTYGGQQYDPTQATLEVSNLFSRAWLATVTPNSYTGVRLKPFALSRIL